VVGLVNAHLTTKQTGPKCKSVTLINFGLSTGNILRSRVQWMWCNNGNMEKHKGLTREIIYVAMWLLGLCGDTNKRITVNINIMKYAKM